jgi:hypothetical protein
MNSKEQVSFVCPFIETRNFIKYLTRITFRDVLQGFIMRTFVYYPHIPTNLMNIPTFVTAIRYCLFR